jgi:hypothetical protein
MPSSARALKNAGENVPAVVIDTFPCIATTRAVLAD